MSMDNNPPITTVPNAPELPPLLEASSVLSSIPPPPSSGDTPKKHNNLKIMIIALSLIFISIIFALTMLLRSTGTKFTTGKDAATLSCSLQDTNIVLVLDRSSSMNSKESDGRTKLAWAKESAKTLVDRIAAMPNVSAKISIVSFGSQGNDGKGSLAATYNSTLHIALSSNFSAVKTAIDGVNFVKSGTCIECGIRIGNNQLTVSALNRVVILLSDGKANHVWSGASGNSSGAIAEANKGRGLGLVYYVLGYGTGSGIDETTLKAIAGKTTNYQYKPNALDWPNAFLQIVDLLCAQPTATPIPTKTPTKTPTPLPSKTSTPKPSATPVPSAVCPASTELLFANTGNLSVGTIVAAGGKVSALTGSWLTGTQSGKIMATGGSVITVDFSSPVKLDTVLIYDNDPKSGESPWSINGQSLPITPDNTWGPAYKLNVTTSQMKFNNGGDSPHFNICVVNIAPTVTPTPTKTPTPTPSRTPTPTPTKTPTPTPSPTKTPTPSPTKTPTPVPSATVTPTTTRTPTPTVTPVPSATVTPAPSSTITPTPSMCPKPNAVTNIRINCPLCQ